MAELIVLNKKPANKFTDQSPKNFKKKFKQLSLFEPSPRVFGGSLLKGKRKEKRTLTTKKDLHLILKDDISFSGPLTLNSKWMALLKRKISFKRTPNNFHPNMIV